MNAESAARDRADHIRKDLGRLADDIAEMGDRIAAAYTAGDHQTLGYTSWPAYCRAEYGTEMMRLTASVRAAWTPALRSAGMATAEIAATFGVDRKTVQRDARPHISDKEKTAATNVAPPPEQATREQAEQRVAEVREAMEGINDASTDLAATLRIVAMLGFEPVTLRVKHAVKAGGTVRVGAADVIEQLARQLEGMADGE